jgi:hypothetical protein
MSQVPSFGAYAYQSLENNRHVRLIEVHKANQTKEPLHVSILHVPLATAKFDALSYTWGTQKLSASLSTPDGSVAITENLESALKDLRLKHGSRLLWVDAISINQQNHAEKASQVALMGEIYSSAESVLVYLGSLSLHSLWALEYLECLAEESSRFGIDPPTGDFRVWLGSPRLEGHEGNAVTILEASVLAHVEAFYDRPWFSRLWVVQEAILANKLILYCGPCQMKWSTFELATTLLVASFDAVGGFPESLKSVFRAWKLIELRNKYQIGLSEKYTEIEQYLSLTIIANEMKSQECSDDRDRVYGFMALSGARKTMVPDYTKTTAQVYSEFAVKHGGCDMLFDAGLARRHPISPFERLRVNPESQKIFAKPSYLPSWVPDLRKRSIEEWRPIFEDVYQTSSSSQGSAFLSPDCPQMYFIHGIRFDYIESWIGLVGEDFKPTQNATSFFTMVSVLEGFYRALVSDFTVYPNGDEWSHAWPLALATAVRRDSAHPLGRYMGDALEMTDEGLEILWESYEDLVIDTDGEISKAIEDLETENIPSDFGDSLSGAAQHTWHYHCYLAEIISRHMIIKTTQGYVGLAPRGVQKGDAIAVFGGPKSPFIIRSVFGDESVSLILGPCYLHGLMNGEIYEEPERSKFDWKVVKKGGNTTILMSGLIGLV